MSERTRENPYAAQTSPRTDLTSGFWRLATIALMLLILAVAALTAAGSFLWLVATLLNTNHLGRSIPPRQFTWDRFGPPLASFILSIPFAVVGLLGTGASVKRSPRSPRDHVVELLVALSLAVVLALALAIAAWMSWFEAALLEVEIMADKLR